MHYSISLNGIGNRINSFVVARRKWPDALLWWPWYKGNHGIVPYFEELFEPRDFVVRTIGPRLYESVNIWNLMPVKMCDTSSITRNFENVSDDDKKEISDIVSLFKPADKLKPQITKIARKRGIHIRTWYDTSHSTPAQTVIKTLESMDLSDTYIACDNLIVQKWLYNNCFTALEPSLSPQRSVVDLFSLAMCDELLLDRNSTYGELALYLGGCKADVKFWY